MTLPLPPFHLAFPVHDLAAAREFWGGTMFFRDPSGNAVEIKAFADMAQLFATG